MSSESALRRVITRNSPVSTSAIAAGRARAPPERRGQRRGRRPLRWPRRRSRSPPTSESRGPTYGWRSTRTGDAPQHRAQDERARRRPWRRSPAARRATRCPRPRLSPTPSAATATSADWTATSQIDRPIERVTASSTPSTTIAGGAGVDERRGRGVTPAATAGRRVPMSGQDRGHAEQAGQGEDPQLGEARVEQAEADGRARRSFASAGADATSRTATGVGRRGHAERAGRPRTNRPDDDDELQLRRVGEHRQAPARGLEQHALVDHRQLEVGVRVVDRLVPGLGDGDDRERARRRGAAPASATASLRPRPGAAIAPRSVVPAPRARRPRGPAGAPAPRALAIATSRLAAHAAERAAGVERRERQDEPGEGQQPDDDEQVAPAVERRPRARRSAPGARRDDHRGEDDRRRRRRSAGSRRRSRPAALPPPLARGRGTAAARDGPRRYWSRALTRLRDPQQERRAAAGTRMHLGHGRPRSSRRHRSAISGPPGAARRRPRRCRRGRAGGCPCWRRRTSCGDGDCRRDGAADTARSSITWSTSPR